MSFSNIRSGYRAKYKSLPELWLSIGDIEYSNRILSIHRSNLVAYWPLRELSGTNADNLEGTTAKDGTYTSVSLNSIKDFDGQPVGSWDGTNSYCNIYSADLNSSFNGQEGTVACWAKVNEASVWTDGILRRIVTLQVDGDNFVRLNKGTTNNQLSIQYKAGTTLLSKFIVLSTTDWFHVAVTFSLVADEYKVYINGVQETPTQTGLGTWVGNLDNIATVIGAGTTTPVSVWNGYLTHCAIWNTPFSSSEIEELAKV